MHTTPTSPNDVVIGATYRHYKQRRYRVLHVAYLEATLEELVIYESLNPDDLGRHWARPKADFLIHVKTESYAGPRFALEPGT